MPVNPKQREIEIITIRLRAPTEQELSDQLRTPNTHLARSNLYDITCKRSVKENRGFRCRARVTARGPLPEVVQRMMDIASIAFHP